MARRYGLAAPMSMAEFEAMENAAERGTEPPGMPPKRTSPGATRTTSNPYCETNQRKPYQPVEDTSTPDLSEGVSYRQKL